MDDSGQIVPYQMVRAFRITFESLDLSPDERAALLDQMNVGFYKGRLISDVSVWFEGNRARLELMLPEYHTGQIGSFAALAHRPGMPPHHLSLRQFPAGILIACVAIRSRLM